jgi:hypothetical protein
MISNSIAGYFLSEMEGWQDSLEFYDKEMVRSDELLKVIIQMNTVPGLAGRVEEFMGRFKAIQEEMKSLEASILAAEGDLIKDEEPISNDVISDAISLQQKEFRSRMHILENRYLELKYECDSFIAETLIVQNKKSG